MQCLEGVLYRDIAIAKQGLGTIYRDARCWKQMLKYSECQIESPAVCQ